MEGLPGRGTLDSDVEQPLRATGLLRPGQPTAGGVRGDHQIGTLEPAVVGDQPPDDRGESGERGVGDDLERSAWQLQPTGVRSHHAHRTPFETIPQQRNPTLVQLDGDDPRAGIYERCRRARRGPLPRRARGHRGRCPPRRPSAWLGGYRARGTPTGRREPRARNARTMIVVIRIIVPGRVARAR